MSDKSPKNLIKAKTNEFLSNKQNAEALRFILDNFKVSAARNFPKNRNFLQIITFCRTQKINNCRQYRIY